MSQSSIILCKPKAWYKHAITTEAFLIYDLGFSERSEIVLKKFAIKLDLSEGNYSPNSTQNESKFCITFLLNTIVERAKHRGSCTHSLYDQP